MVMPSKPPGLQLVGSQRIRQVCCESLHSDTVTCAEAPQHMADEEIEHDFLHLPLLLAS